MPNLTVEQILAGTTTGRLQAVGQMAIIPLLGDGDDTFAPPTDLEAGTRNYGTVDVRNRADRPTIVPTGAAWVTSEDAQDHASPGAALISAQGSRSIDNAYCIQETQGGLLMRQAREFVVLPASLRAQALANRNRGSYDALWTHIRRFKGTMGLRGAGNLVEFLKAFKTELDQFVAEFEIVPGQLGAIIAIGGQIVGIERAPSEAFWHALWVPLVRVCYGSLALRVARSGAGIPSTRTPLSVTDKSLEGIAGALAKAREDSRMLVDATMGELGPKALASPAQADEAIDGSSIFTLACQEYAGQIIQRDAKPVYASICAASV